MTPQNRFSTIWGVAEGGCEARASIIYPPRPTPHENPSNDIKSKFSNYRLGGQSDPVPVERLSSHPPPATPYIVQNSPSRSPGGCAGHV